MRELKRREVVAYTGLMTVATFVTGGINFVFNMVVGKLIGPVEYGVLSPLMGSLFSLLSMPVMGLQLFMNQSLGEIFRENPQGIRSFIRFLFMSLMKILVVLEIVLFLAIPLLQVWLKLPDKAVLMVLFVIVLVNYVQIFFYAVLQFQHEFLLLFWVTTVTTLMKLGLGIVLALKWKTAFSLMFAYLVPMVLAAFVYGWMLWQWYRELPNTGCGRYQHFWKSFVVSMVSGGAYMVLSSFDVLLVRSFFLNQAVVGTYAMAGLIARASFFLASAFTTVFLPVMAKRKERSHLLTLWGLGVLVVILLGYTGCVWIFRSLIAEGFLGGNYPGLKEYLAPYTFWFIPYALISFLVSFYTVHKSLVYGALIGLGVIAQGVLFSVWHESISQALLIVGGVGYGLLFCFVVEILWQRRRA
ncbi:oligosaccharide flippase family protein [Thermospira aquatica]|uniref:Oligosaccharide flippase family protein n=1 Tax=Thermospira aquatica TaxID=2828656 RepID=A0AAX3BEY8_9SPIR|nr:oligosaccharide flippase family protein [Thermospira aquatica]URA10705.1 oligosaccharide flippase family protein [Thermospira aquatica]